MLSAFFPWDVAAMRADFAVGGSYKYLRGGPGACFLYLSPEILASGLRPLDTGWFARENTFGYERHDPPSLRAGGNAFLESTPPVLTYYQARSGQQFTLAIAVERLRQYGQRQLSQLKLYLADAGDTRNWRRCRPRRISLCSSYVCQRSCQKTCREQYHHRRSW